VILRTDATANRRLLAAVRLFGRAVDSLPITPVPSYAVSEFSTESKVGCGARRLADGPDTRALVYVMASTNGVWRFPIFSRQTSSVHGTSA